MGNEKKHPKDLPPVFGQVRPIEETRVRLARMGSPATAASELTALEVDLMAHRNSGVYMFTRLHAMADHIEELDRELMKARSEAQSSGSRNTELAAQLQQVIEQQDRTIVELRAQLAQALQPSRGKKRA